MALDPYAATPQPMMGALASAASDPTAYKPDQFAASAGVMKEANTYTPSADALVSNNLTKLISSDNPYMQRARTKAAQYANSRGLLNSSIAAGAGEAAAIDAAAPIAQGDANAYQAAEAANAVAKNTFALDSNQFQRQGALASLNAGFQSKESALDRAQKDSQFQGDLGLRKDTLAADTGIRQSDLALRGKSLDSDTALRQGALALQTKGQEADIGLRGSAQDIERDRIAKDSAIKQADLEQQMQRTYLDARTQLETSPNLDAAAKATAINAMSDWFYDSALPAVRARIGSPAAWPGPVTTTPTSAAPAPAPAASAPATGKPPPVQAPPPAAQPAEVRTDNPTTEQLIAGYTDSNGNYHLPAGGGA